MRRWLVLLVACVAIAVGVPGAWFATRPCPDAGVDVADIGVPVTTPTAAPAGAVPGRATVTARPAVPSPVQAGPTPARLSIPAVGVDAAVEPVGVDAAGLMIVPRDVRQVGWYQYGPAPGDGAGAAVLVGHVDAARQGPGALFFLREVDVGDRITITLDGGRHLSYRVVAKQTIVKQQLPVARLFARDGVPRLVLITCGGPFVPELHSYRDNLVVVATPA